MKQHTIKSGFAFDGKGLHTGCILHAEFKPAAENTGIRICRTDLPDKPCYEATADYVSATERGTVLEKGEWRVSTVEHALSALYAMGVDNCLIEVDGPEIPILDGSAKYYVDAIKRVGIEEQKAEQKVFVVRHKIEYKNEETGTKITLLPDDDYSLDVHISFPSEVLHNQYASLESMSDYATEIAPARTFCFVREIRGLLSHGLIKGGDLQNALVIYDQELSQEEFDQLALQLGQPTQDASKLGYLSALHHDNEPARHKLLDLIGDLSLIGCRIQGRVIATRPGHGANTQFCKQLRKEMRKTEILPPVFNRDDKPLLGIADIRHLLPHRYPMLFVDKVLQMTDKTIIAMKNFTTNEPFFQGHFPNEPIVPGVLLLEAMAQAGGILVLHDKPDASNYSTYFVKINNAKFRQKVLPGDTLIFRMELLEPIRRGIVVMQGYCFVDERLVAEAELTAQIVKNIK